MHRGTVLKYDDEKGIGAVRPDDGGPDVQVHYSVIEHFGFQTLRPGQAVEYEARDSHLGPRATFVRPLEDDQYPT